MEVEGPNQQQQQQQQEEEEGFGLPARECMPREVPILQQDPDLVTRGSKILYIVAGGDHSMAVLQAPTGSTSSGSSSTGLTALAAIDEAAAAVTGGGQTTPMDIDQSTAAPTRAAPAVQHGPDPRRSKYGANMLPVNLPNLFDLAAAAAAEQAEAKEAPPRSPRLLHSPRGSAAAGVFGAATSPSAAALASAVFDLWSNMGFLLHMLQGASSRGQVNPPGQSLTNKEADVDSSTSSSRQSGGSASAAAGDGSSSASTSPHHQQQQQQQVHSLSLPPSGVDQALTGQLYSAVLKTYVPEAVGALGAGVLRLLQELQHSGEWGSGASLEVVQLLLVLLQVRWRVTGAGHWCVWCVGVWGSWASMAMVQLLLVLLQVRWVSHSLLGGVGGGHWVWVGGC
jgi:hypothetical protein